MRRRYEKSAIETHHDFYTMLPAYRLRFALCDRMRALVSAEIAAVIFFIIRCGPEIRERRKRERRKLPPSHQPQRIAQTKSCSSAVSVKWNEPCRFSPTTQVADRFHGCQRWRPIGPRSQAHERDAVAVKAVIFAIGFSVCTELRDGPTASNLVLRGRWWCPREGTGLRIFAGSANN